MSCSLLMVCVTALCAAETPAAVAVDLKPLSLSADAVVVAHIGQLSKAPQKTGGAAALWVEQALKGPLQGRRDIFWLPTQELPDAQLGSLYLLTLSQDSDGAWHVAAGGAQKLKTADDVAVAELTKFIGKHHGLNDEAAPSEAEFGDWLRRAGRGAGDTRRSAYARLIAAGDSARGHLISAAASEDRELSAVARSVLSLTGGGPTVNGIRLVLEPATLELNAGDTRNLRVILANVTDANIRVVTGASTRDDNIMASAAYEVRLREADPSVLQPALPTVLPKSYGENSFDPLPIVRTVPRSGVLSLAVGVQLERVALQDRGVYRLKFPNGHIDLPRPGLYSVRVRFECPGPRPDQTRLSGANYWAGGQLISNEITVSVPPPRG